MQTQPQTTRLQIAGGTFEPEGHIYRDAEEHRVLSVTQIFQLLGLVDFSGIDPDVLWRKSQIGIAVHKAIELLTTTGLDWDTVDDIAMAYVVGTEQWLRRHQFKLEAAEQQGIHVVNGMAYGYQMDLRGTILYRNVATPVIIDLKTTVKKSPLWKIQLAAYELAAPPLPDNKSYLRVILHLQKDGRVKPYYFDKIEDRATFLYMAYVATWARNEGLLAA